MSAARRAPLSDARWHFQHGPIDLVIGADGDPAAVAAAHEAAWRRFEPLLGELVAELPALRAPLVDDADAPCPVRGPVARRMWQACRPFRAVYITPMAAVAGSVAQEIVACYARPGIRRAWVNNGGDIALALADAADGKRSSLRIGVFSDLSRVAFAVPSRAAQTGIAQTGITQTGIAQTGIAQAGIAQTGIAQTGIAQADLVPDARLLDGHVEIDAAMPVRGVATSGWRGRSHSLGIADGVTVLARTAAMADAAATIVANAVDVRDPRIARAPACTLKDDSDLGRLEVTVDVPPLEPSLVQHALQAGARRAGALQRAGLLHAAVLVCQRRALRVDPIPAPAELGSVFA